MDWYQMGKSDGSQGNLQRDLSKDIQDCAQYKIPVDTAGYQKGWGAGTRIFCQPGNGYSLGVRGQTFNNVCPGNLANSFTSAWRRGLRKFCTVPTGYNLGRDGKPLPNFCPSDLQPRFANAYSHGRRIFDQIANLQAQLDSINSQLSSVQNRVNANNNSISDNYSTISKAKADLAVNKPRKARRYDHKTIRNAYEMIDRLRNDNAQLQGQLNGLNEEKQNLQQQITIIQSRTD